MKHSENIDFDPICERKNTFEPIHPKFEIGLLVNSFKKHSSSDKCSKWALEEASRIFQSFLEKCFAQHHNLPNDSLSLNRESEEPENSIDLNGIRKSIRELQRLKHLSNLKLCQSSAEFLTLRMNWEMHIGIRDQEQGKDQNESVFRIRQQETRNQQILLSKINGMNISIF